MLIHQSAGREPSAAAVTHSFGRCAPASLASGRRLRLPGPSRAPEFKFPLHRRAAQGDRSIMHAMLHLPLPARLGRRSTAGWLPLRLPWALASRGPVGCGRVPACLPPVPRALLGLQPLAVRSGAATFALATCGTSRWVCHMRGGWDVVARCVCVHLPAVP
jgi:hypothetical protein